MGGAAFVILAFVVSTMVASWFAFRALRLPRPAVGVFGLGDVAVLLAATVLLPFLYLILPLPLVAGVLLAASASAVDMLLAATGRHGWIAWVLTLGLLGADVSSAILLGSMHPVFLLINNFVLGVVVVSVTVLWAQSGLRASSAAVLCGAIAVYDLVATAWFPLTDQLLERLTAIPLAPMLAWVSGDGNSWMSIGLGDVLLASLFPLVQRKAFGSTAGILALGTSLGTLAVLVWLGLVGVLPGSFPVMVVLGPLVVLQYEVVRRTRGHERTTWQYLQETAVDSKNLDQRCSRIGAEVYIPCQEQMRPVDPFHQRRAT